MFSLSPPAGRPAASSARCALHSAATLHRCTPLLHSTAFRNAGNSQGCPACFLPGSRRELAVPRALQVYFQTTPAKVFNLRPDTLAILMHEASVAPHARVLCIDACFGLVATACAERMGGHGVLCCAHLEPQRYRLETPRLLNVSAWLAVTARHTALSKLLAAAPGGAVEGLGCAPAEGAAARAQGAVASRVPMDVDAAAAGTDIAGATAAAAACTEEGVAAPEAAASKAAAPLQADSTAAAAAPSPTDGAAAPRQADSPAAAAAQAPTDGTAAPQQADTSAGPAAAAVSAANSAQPADSRRCQSA